LQIKYNTFTMHLEEMPLDIGYASEKISVTSKTDNKEEFLGGQNGKTQLLIGVPFIDEQIKAELMQIDANLPSGGDYEVTASVILAEAPTEALDFKKIKIFIDDKEEFRDFYGTKLSGEPLEGGIAKALILISKDGAIFYDDFVTDIDENFKTDILARKIHAAQTCYTGKGCH
jgi:peroxiredoxin